ncbi:non-specific serine/threonine protein kinase [Entamoeba marina]
MLIYLCLILNALLGFAFHVADDFVIFFRVDGVVTSHNIITGQQIWKSNIDPFVSTCCDQIMIPSVDSTHSLFSLNKVTGGLNKLPFKIEGMYMNSPFIVDNHEILTLIKSTIIGIDVDNGYVCENECELLENNKRNIARFMKKEYITIAYMDHIVKTNTTFTILNTINGNSIDFLTLRHNLHNKNVEMILPNSEKQEMWKVKIDKEIGFAFYYSRRNNELYQIPVHIKVIQHQLNLGSFEYRGNQMMYASISDFFNQCFEDEKPFLLTQNPKSQNIESIDVITNKINQVSDQKITTSLEFPPITKEQFMQYPNIQSYVSHMNKKINDSSISNETLFVLIVIVLISFLGFVFVVMILYVNYIKKLLKNNKKVHQLFEVTKTILGHGCLGTIVFEGKYQNKRIAVKRLVKEFHQVAQNEMSVISMTDEKPHLVRCYGSFTDENFIYIGLTYCPYTLDEYLKKYFTYSPNTPLLNEETVRLMRECATGIYYLHQLGIVHRDIKPQNVLVDHENRIRITDFGLSKSLDPHSSSFSNSTNKGK